MRLLFTEEALEKSSGWRERITSSHIYNTVYYPTLLLRALEAHVTFPLIIVDRSNAYTPFVSRCRQMVDIVHIFIHLPQAVLVETCEGLASNFTIVKPTEALL